LPAARLFSGIGRASIKRFRAGRPFQRPDGVLSIARTTARLVAERIGDVSCGAWPDFGDIKDPLAARASQQDGAPWLTDSPLILPPGAISLDDRGTAWWQAADDPHGIALPIAGAVDQTLLGIDLGATAALWNGARLDLLAAQSGFGRLDLS